MKAQSKIEINNLIHHEKTASNNNKSQIPPTVIRVCDLEPLRLAKKKHYALPEESRMIGKKKASRSKTQGRPFNDSLNARFLFFNTIDDLIADVMNYKVNYITHVTNMVSFKHDGIMVTNSQQLKVKMPQCPAYEIKSIEFEKDSKLATDSIHDDLCGFFNTGSMSFVKLIRNNKGQLVKFEILSQVRKQALTVNYIKKFITYPRYKSKMKIYLMNGSFDSDIWFYNDLRMLLWDLENVDITGKKLLVNNTALKR